MCLRVSKGRLGTGRDLNFGFEGCEEEPEREAVNETRVLCFQIDEDRDEAQWGVCSEVKYSLEPWD